MTATMLLSRWLVEQITEPTTWDAVVATFYGLLVAAIGAAVPFILVWLRNLKTQQDIAHAMLLQQQADLKANTETTTAIEKQTNGALARAREDAMKALAIAERLRSVNREQQWIIEELQKLEEGRALIDRVMCKRSAVVAERDYDDLMARLMREAQK